MLNSFTKAYVECALWSSTGDDTYDISSLAPETLAKVIADCARFQEDNHTLLEGAECIRGRAEYTMQEQAGHDFWLTRNGHGAGFWAGSWNEGEKLTEASKKFGECDLYVGDDGMLYLG